MHVQPPDYMFADQLIEALLRAHDVPWTVPDSMYGFAAPRRERTQEETPPCPNHPPPPASAPSA